MRALRGAGLTMGDITYVLGDVSVSTWTVPNDLMLFARHMGVSEGARIIPLTNYYSNFSAALDFADALVARDPSAKIMLAVGSNLW